MNTQVILSNDTLTKTEKIRQLLALGLTRRQVADLTGGNYGFVQNVFAKYWPEQVRSKYASFAFIPFNRRFGVEIEAYGVSKTKVAQALRDAGIECYDEHYNHHTRTHWKVVSDSSLNGTESFELVSPILEGLEGLAQVETVSRVLVRLKAKINKSCGMHIHFDASGFGLNQLKNTVVNYANYEAIIDAFMPVSRRENYYCKSLQTLATQVDRADSIRQLEALQPDRYYKLNLKSYSRHESIEFRQHSGTVEFEKIKNWIIFLHNLVEYSRTKRVSRPEATFGSLSKFQQPEVVTYLQNRTNDLAA